MSEEGTLHDNWCGESPEDKIIRDLRARLAEAERERDELRARLAEIAEAHEAHQGHLAVLREFYAGRQPYDCRRVDAEVKAMCERERQLYSLLDALNRGDAHAR